MSNSRSIYYPRGPFPNLSTIIVPIQMKMLGVFLFIETIGYVSKLKALETIGYVSKLKALLQMSYEVFTNSCYLVLPHLASKIIHGYIWDYLVRLDQWVFPGARDNNCDPRHFILFFTLVICLFSIAYRSNNRLVPVTCAIKFYLGGDIFWSF